MMCLNLSVLISKLDIIIAMEIIIMMVMAHAPLPSPPIQPCTIHILSVWDTPVDEMPRIPDLPQPEWGSGWWWWTINNSIIKSKLSYNF